MCVHCTCTLNTHVVIHSRWLMAASLPQALLTLVSIVFNPSWKAMEKALGDLRGVAEREREREREMKHHISLLEQNGRKNPLTTTSFRYTRHTSLTSTHTSLTSMQRSDDSQSQLSDVFCPSQPDSLGEVYFNMSEEIGRASCRERV